MKLLGDNIREGDVILCNHPSCGGSHLPDLTVITPVRYETTFTRLNRSKFVKLSFADMNTCTMIFNVAD